MTPRTLKLNAHRTLMYYTPEDVEAMRAEITALKFRVDQQRIIAGHSTTDLQLARSQRDEAYKVLRRISRFRLADFSGPHSMALNCVQEAAEFFPDED